MAVFWFVAPAELAFGEGEFGEGSAQLFESNVLSVSKTNTTLCKRDAIDLTELARYPKLLGQHLDGVLTTDLTDLAEFIQDQ